MIEYKTGNILDADVEALVNSVNCVGVMGRGVALQFKRAFPENFKAYRAACQRREVVPGKMFIFETGLLQPRYIINFPTKRHWRGKSRIEDIEIGLQALVEEVVRRKIRSIAIPPLGCGLGGLKWEEVRRRIEQAFNKLPEVRVVVYEPLEKVPLPASIRRGPIPKMTPERAVLVELIYRYLQGLLDPTISLLELHKLMYFVQEAGEPLKLRFVKGPYGPYAENLRHALLAIEGYYISGYGAGGDDPRKVLELVPGALEEARQVLEKHEETKRRLLRVSELIKGFESPHGLELLATVHWIITKEKQTKEEELVKAFYAWDMRKNRFTRNQIVLAARVLQAKGWV